ncbi:MAG: PD-(D/E)XK nuclease family protein [Verrucomicrobiota bacterium]|nr:PD-(D/E)XK nuclease family protein [Verrucomicrobiota bacterium]
MKTRAPSLPNERSSARLILASSPREAWDGVVRSWIKATAAGAWQRSLPSIVVVPSVHHANACKSRLLALGDSLLGLHFLTPFALREFLRSYAPAVTTPAPHLRLLLAIAAEQASPNESNSAPAAAVSRAPENLLRTLERLEGAGWDFDQLPFAAFRPIVRRFRDDLSRCDFALTAQVDRAAAAATRSESAKISRLLLSGFDGAHWPLWFLLQAAVGAAEESTVILADPRDEARTFDETWIGTWEEHHGEAKPIATPRQSETLFPDLFEADLFASKSSGSSPEKYFAVGRAVTDQAEAIAGLVKSFLASASADRIGVLFPAAGALPRSVAALLSAAKIPHYDGIAHLAPGPLEDDAWPIWLELQDSPRLRILLRFLRASPAACNFFSGLHVDRIEDILRRASANLLIDDLPLLRAYLPRRAPSDDADKIVAGLDAIRFLPEHATLSEFLAQTCDIFENLAWLERRAHLQELTAGWSARVSGEFSRAIYLRWLAEISSSVLPERGRDGDHPYSRVQLLLPTHAEGQTWSHLIFAGLNEGAWPARPNESGFLDDRDIAGFNSSIRKLNQRALRQGRQGEGHSIVAEGKTFFLGPAEQRALAERQFQNLCESVTVAIAASASLIEETAPERYANPSEFFTRLYLEAEGDAPGQATMAALEARTAKWLAREKNPPSTASNDDIVQTARAYRARHQPEVAFGEYEFSLREPLPEPLTLSATDCERIIKVPALVWLKKFLGAEARDAELANWNVAIGQWVHDWLACVVPSNGEFVVRPSPKDVRERVKKAARQFRVEVQQLLGHALPDWWLSAWNQAAFIADTLAETITATEAWSHFATEWKLPSLGIRVSENEELRVRGRIDLLLAREAATDASFPFREAWIIDYKTGRRASLAPGRMTKDAAQDFQTKLLEGKGVQLAIYALALHSLGAQDIGASLLTRELELDRPQVSLPVIEAPREIWLEFARLSRSGIFGMRGELRGEFRFQKDYPLATLGFDPDFLDEKWNRTHPGLPKIEKR